MSLYILALYARDNTNFEFSYDNEWHYMSSDEITRDVDEYSTYAVASWFISSYEENTVIVTCL